MKKTTQITARLIDAVGISNKAAVSGQTTRGLANLKHKCLSPHSQLAVVSTSISGSQPSPSNTDQRDDSLKAQEANLCDCRRGVTGVLLNPPPLPTPTPGQIKSQLFARNKGSQ